MGLFAMQSPLTTVDVNVLIDYTKEGRNQFMYYYAKHASTDEQAYWFGKCHKGMYHAMKITNAGASMQQKRFWLV